MRLSANEILNLLESPEDSDREFKRIKFKGGQPHEPRRQVSADEIAAFANSEGGLLQCGVTDQHEVQGMTREQGGALERCVVEIASNSIRPPIRIDTYFTGMGQGEFVLAVKIPAGYSRHLSPGGGFHRVGSSKRRMTGDDELRLAQRRGQSRFLWYDKQSVPGTGFGSLAR